MRYFIYLTSRTDRLQDEKSPTVQEELGKRKNLNLFQNLGEGKKWVSFYTDVNQPFFNVYIICTMPDVLIKHF